MYSDEERQIFRFEIAGQKRAVDPVAALRKICTYGEIDIEKDFANIALSDEDKNPTKDELESYNLVIEASREAFGLPAFDNDEGFLDNEVLEILDKFLEYSDSLKKKSVTSPMSAPSMAAAS